MTDPAKIPGFGDAFREDVTNHVRTREAVLLAWKLLNEAYRRKTTTLCGVGQPARRYYAVAVGANQSRAYKELERAGVIASGEKVGHGETARTQLTLTPEMGTSASTSPDDDHDEMGTPASTSQTGDVDVNMDAGVHMDVDAGVQRFSVLPLSTATADADGDRETEPEPAAAAALEVLEPLLEQLGVGKAARVEMRAEPDRAAACCRAAIAEAAARPGTIDRPAGLALTKFRDGDDPKVVEPPAIPRCSFCRIPILPPLSLEDHERRCAPEHGFPVVDPEPERDEQALEKIRQLAADQERALRARNVAAALDGFEPTGEETPDADLTLPPELAEL